jgi:predicted alpha/beta-fold hydrolase
MVQFLRSLHGKVLQKMAAMPGRISDEGFDRIRTFREFDDRYTAPLHGFRDAADYYAQCSSGRVLHRINLPVLVVNAADDPFLAGGCYPAAAAAQSRHVHLETPASGGHVGFMELRSDGAYWSERRAAEFLGEMTT